MLGNIMSNEEDVRQPHEAKERDLTRRIYDRLESSYNQGYQRITIALAVANAALGIILLAPQPGALEDLIASPRRMPWTMWSLVMLGLAILILLSLSVNGLKSPLSITGYDVVEPDQWGHRDYEKWERTAYAAAAYNCETKLQRRRKTYVIAVALTSIGIGLYIVARCA